MAEFSLKNGISESGFDNAQLTNTSYAKGFVWQNLQENSSWLENPSSRTVFLRCSLWPVPVCVILAQLQTRKEPNIPKVLYISSFEIDCNLGVRALGAGARASPIVLLKGVCKPCESAL
jgi:hypothetical protein